MWLGCVMSLREQSFDGSSQLRQSHGLAELDAVIVCDITERVGGYVAGQDDDGNLSMKSVAELRSDLKSVHVMWQIVVRNHKVRPDHSPRSKCHCRHPIWRCRRAMTFCLKE